MLYRVSANRYFFLLLFTLLFLEELFLGPQIFRSSQPVDIQNSIQVIDFMLDDSGRPII